MNKHKISPRRRRIEPDADAAFVQQIIAAMIAGQGHGGLKWAAQKLGLSSSNLRKRLVSEQGAFDAPTLRAALLVLACKADKFAGVPLRTAQYGEFAIDLHQTENGPMPAWRIVDSATA